MQVEVVKTGWRGLNMNPGVALLAVGAFFGALRMGALAGVVICVVTVGGMWAISRTSSWTYRRRTRSESSAEFRAPATLNGEVGSFRSSARQYTWSKRDGTRTMQLEPSGISTVRLRRVPLVNATEASFELSDGSTEVVTISAPMDEVAEALAS